MFVWHLILWYDSRGNTSKATQIVNFSLVHAHILVRATFITQNKDMMALHQFAIYAFHVKYSHRTPPTADTYICYKFVTFLFAIVYFHLN